MSNTYRRETFTGKLGLSRRYALSLPLLLCLYSRAFVECAEHFNSTTRHTQGLTSNKKIRYFSFVVEQFGLVFERSFGHIGRLILSNNISLFFIARSFYLACCL
jgi:hypothetical protein